MITVTLNKDFRITLPKPIREFMKLKPGMKVDWKVEGNSLKLFPVITNPKNQ